MKKLAVQFVATAIEEAVGRVFWVKSSVTMNQGMEPGPVAKKITKRSTKTMLK
jgi:hypothetical protein